MPFMIYRNLDHYGFITDKTLVVQSNLAIRIKDRFDKEQIGIKEPFPVTNLPFTS